MKLEQRIAKLEDAEPDPKLGRWSIPIERMYGYSEEEYPDVWVTGSVPTLADFYGKLPE